MLPGLGVTGSLAVSSPITQNVRMPLPIRIALIAWLVQPLYVLTEIAVAARSRAHYSFMADTISALGITTCRSPSHPHVCSPAHGWMNASFIVFGVCVAAGAVAVQRALPHSRLLTTTAALWLLTGLGSVAVGLVPIDRSEPLHYAVALPIFLVRPLALALSAHVLAATHPTLARVTWVIAALTAVGVAGFGLGIAPGDARGTFERLALWPGDVWFALVAGALLAATSPRRHPGPKRNASAG